MLLIYSLRVGIAELWKCRRAASAADDGRRHPDRRTEIQEDAPQRHFPIQHLWVMNFRENGWHPGRHFYHQSIHSSLIEKIFRYLDCRKCLTNYYDIFHQNNICKICSESEQDYTSMTNISYG
ncbi:hypothetical protein TNIN_305341 [Trichonephila inaurata madagascariensis]|uniref:Uncharacterized protein n=1 Tax=Trichonephila inaurata madagascariensis TaxID=2747483 RepID=A0A8X6YBR6_9ARAC|nr:hypothetical protein TNIN_305341 [Trichonephila inaurata madagascariensis]